MAQVMPAQESTSTGFLILCLAAIGIVYISYLGGGIPVMMLVAALGLILTLVFGTASYFALGCAIIVHVIDAILGFDRSSFTAEFLIVYLLMFLIALWVYGLGENGRNMGVFALVSFLSFLLPFVKGLLSKLIPNVFSVYIDGIILFAPIWVCFLLLTRLELRQVGMLYISLWIVIFSINFSYVAGTQGISSFAKLGLTADVIDVSKPIGILWSNTVRSFWYAYTRSKGLILGFSDTVSSGFERQIQEAIGGQQEQGKKFVGLTIVDIASLAGVPLLEGEPITVIARLKAGVLDQEIPVVLQCEATKTSEKGIQRIRGEVRPQERLTIYSEYDDDTDCSFSSLSKGSYDVSMSALYDFETIGSVSHYVISSELFAALTKRARKEGSDPNNLFFSQYGLASLGDSISTGGPVLVALSVGKPVLVIDDTNPSEHILKVTIRNLWEGSIKTLKELIIVTPKGFEIRDVAGKDPKGEILQSSCNEIPFARCDDEQSVAYRVPIKATGIKSIQNIRVYLTPSSTQDILTGIYTIKTFKVIADYTYQIEKSTSLIVKEEAKEVSQV